MKKLLLLAASAVCGLTSVAHDIAAFNVSQNITASRINNTNNGTAWWIIPAARNQQYFGSRFVSKSAWEAGMYNLKAGLEYAATWDRSCAAATDFATKSFKNLDLENVRVTLTTGSNITITGGKMPDPQVKPDHVDNPHVTATLYINSLEDEGGQVYTAILKYGVCADDLTKTYDYLPQSVEINTPDGKMFDQIGSMKFLFENVVKGSDWVTLRNTYFPCLHEWVVRSVCLASEVVAHNTG